MTQAIVDQGLTVEELLEMIDLGDDCVWHRPLSRARVIAHLDRLNRPEQQQSSLPQPPQQHQQQQGEHQESIQPIGIRERDGDIGVRGTLQAEAVESQNGQLAEQPDSSTAAATCF